MAPTSQKRLINSVPALTDFTTHLAEFLPLVVRQQRSERLEAVVDALHPPALVAVRNLPPDPLLRLHGGRWRLAAFIYPAEKGTRMSELAFSRRGYG